MQTFLFFATALLLGFTLLPFSRGKVWWIRILDFPRLQIGVLALLVAGAQASDGFPSEPWEIAVIALNAAIALYQLFWIAPFTRFARREAANCAEESAAHLVRIVTVNVLQSNRRAARLRRLIRQARPDVLLAVETDDWWLQQLAGVASELPHRLECPLDNLYGMTLFSRWPLHDGKVQFLVDPKCPSIHVTVMLPDGECVRLVCLHPQPPSPTEADESTERDAELILVARSLRHEKRPTIVIGDLNDVAWSRTTRLFRKISGLLDPRVGRGLISTYHAKLPFLRWPVDHLFHSRHFTIVTLQRLAGFGSDHFPVFAELALGRAAAANQTAPRADAADEHESHKEVRRAPPREAVHVPASPRK